MNTSVTIVIIASFIFINITKVSLGDTHMKHVVRECDINKEEAIRLVREYIQSKKLDNHYVLSKPQVFFKHSFGDKYWRVVFPTSQVVRRKLHLQWGAFLVDKITGKVEFLGDGPS